MLVAKKLSIAPMLDRADPAIRTGRAVNLCARGPPTSPDRQRRALRSMMGHDASRLFTWNVSRKATSRNPDERLPARAQKHAMAQQPATSQLWTLSGPCRGSWPQQFHRRSNLLAGFEGHGFSTSVTTLFGSKTDFGGKPSSPTCGLISRPADTAPQQQSPLQKAPLRRFPFKQGWRPHKMTLP